MSITRGEGACLLDYFRVTIGATQFPRTCILHERAVDIDALHEIRHLV